MNKSVIVIVICLAIFYYVLGNLRPKLRSTLRCIQLIAAVTYPNLQEYGFEKVLQPFIADANKLSHVSMGRYLIFGICNHIGWLCTAGSKDQCEQPGDASERSSISYVSRYSSCPFSRRIQSWCGIFVTKMPYVHGSS